MALTRLCGFLIRPLVRITRSVVRCVVTLAKRCTSAAVMVHEAHKARMQYDSGYVTALFGIVLNVGYIVFAERRVRAQLEHLTRGLVSRTGGLGNDFAY